jgi:alpha-1,2-glucosyltransferase
VEHPFILADNRHFTFYIWRRIFRFHPLVKYLLSPIYVFCIIHIWWTLAFHQSWIWILGWITASILMLVPSPLLEFRYFILPFMIYRLHMFHGDERKLRYECLYYIGVNMIVFYLFLYRPFQWEHVPNEWQRFMW